MFCSRSMCFAAGVVLALALPCSLVGQKTEDDLRARLIQQPLYLRGQWGSDKLAFDGAGHLVGTATQVTFTLSGVEIGSVKLTRKGLVLEGQRVGLEFNKDVSKRVGLVLRDLAGVSPEKVMLQIQKPADGDFTAALDTIFTGSIAGLDDPLPEYWQPFAQKHLLPAAVPAATGTVSAAGADASRPPSPGLAPMRRIGGGVTAPKVLTQAEPEFTASARSLKYSGTALLTFIVGKDGLPSEIRIVHPLGLGLDEHAVTTLSHYTFQPAMEGGAPVAVRLNIEINFQIF